MTSINSVVTTIEDSLTSVETRSFDKYVLGPFLIWYGIKSKGMTKWPRRLMVTAGIFQLMYNWKDYQKLQAGLSKSPAELINVISDQV